MKRACGDSCRICEMASAPPSFGSRRSISVTSGLCLRCASTASRPSAASAITARSGTVLSSATRPCRTTVWSSTIMMRIDSLIVSLLSFSSICGDFYTYPRALAFVTFECQRAADLLRALLHPGDSKMSITRRSRLSGKAAAIVLDTQYNASNRELQLNLYPLRISMSHGIGHRLLRDAHELAFHLVPERTIRAIHAHFRPDLRARCDAICHFRKLRGQVLILDALRAQLPDRIARVFEPAADKLLRLVQVRFGCF